MRALVKHLDHNGHIVFNNHKNLSSLRNRLARMLNRGRTRDMNLNDVQRLADAAGLTVEKIYHIGVIPSSEDWLLLPRHFHHYLEKLLSGSSIFRDFAQNHIFVCRRSQATHPNTVATTQADDCQTVEA